MASKAQKSQKNVPDSKTSKRSQSSDKKADKQPKQMTKAAAKKKEAAKGKNGRKPGAKKPNIFKRFANYLHAVRIELKRVSWPDGRTVRNQTITVIVALVFFGVLIYLVDSAVTPLLSLYSQLLG